MRYWKVWALAICFVLFWAGYIFLISDPEEVHLLTLVGLATFLLLVAIGLFAASIFLDWLDRVVAGRQKK